MTINHGALGPDAEVRQAVGMFARANEWQSAWQLLTSFGPFLAGCAAMYLVFPVSYLLTLALAVPTGALLVRVFIVQHDCGHGSFFASRRANALVGRACSLITLTPFANWARQHNLHHADWNNLDRTGGGADIYSSCLTVRSYLALSPWQRLLYRLPRHPLIANVLLPPLVFLLLYRVPFDTPRGWARERWSVYLTNAALICLFGTLTIARGLAGGADGARADHGRGVDPRRLAVLAAASLRDGALDGQGRLEFRRRGARGLVMVSPAEGAALADRQYRFPSRPPSQSPRPQLPAERRPRGRA